MSSPCPWGSENIDLRQVNLTAEHKRWLAMAHLQGHFTVEDLHQKYELSVNALYVYVRKVRCGEPVPGNNGSPRKLDGQSLPSLKDLVRANPNVDEKPFRAQIRKECRISQEEN